jgi:hypothetical protein
LPEDLVNEGQKLINQYRALLSNRFGKEVAIATISVVNRPFRPNWTLDDYVDSFPLLLNIKQVNRAYMSIVNAQGTISWKTPQEQLVSFIDRIYPEVQKQVYKDHKSRIIRGFSKQALVAKTKRIMDLGDLYFLNTSKKARPTIVATALIAGLTLRLEAGQCKQKICCLRWFDLSAFEHVSFFRKPLMTSRLFEYFDFLYTCAKYVPWIKEPVKKYVHYYVNDILDMFGKPSENSEPAMKLDLGQYSPYCIAKNTRMREAMEHDLASAQHHLQGNTKPTDESSMVYMLYRLLQYGFDDDQIRNWSQAYIRGMVDSLSFRESFGTYTPSEKDLDRKELDERDMKAEEIAVYLR